VCEAWNVDLVEDLDLGYLQADGGHIWSKHGGGNGDLRKLHVSPSAVLCWYCHSDLTKAEDRSVCVTGIGTIRNE